MTDLKIAATSQDLTEECYVGAVRGGCKCTYFVCSGEVCEQ